MGTAANSTDRSDAAYRARVLRERAIRLARPVAQPESFEHEVEVVRFQAAGFEFIVDCAIVRESCAIRELTPLPCAPGHVAGVFNLRGEIVPIVDLGEVMGIAPADENVERVLVLSSSLGPVAVRIDSLAEVREVPWVVTPVEQSDTELPHEYLQGFLGGSALLDVEALVSRTYLPPEEDAELVEE